MNTPRTIAIFDFDHTLVKGDSFWPFIAYTVGWPKTILATAQALRVYYTRRFQNENDPELADRRTFLKRELLRRTLAGLPLTKIAPTLLRMRNWLQWHEPMHSALMDHKAKGHHIVIASGGLALYLPELFKDIGVDAIICTEIDVKDGVIVGMNGMNCVRQTKADLVKAYLEKNGPFAESWGYGNVPHDLPMLQHVKHRIIV